MAGPPDLSGCDGGEARLSATVPRALERFTARCPPLRSAAAWVRATLSYRAPYYVCRHRRRVPGSLREGIRSLRGGPLSPIAATENGLEGRRPREGEDSPFTYLREIERIPPCTPSEEAALGRAVLAARVAASRRSRSPRARLHRIAREGYRARTRLVEANLRLVPPVARRYTGLGMPLRDLIQEGNIGLIRATASFDPNRGTRFAAYAFWWVRHAITRSLSNQGRAIRVPVRGVELLRRVQRAEEASVQRMGRQPGIEELAAITGTTPAMIQSILEAGRPPTSLDGTLPVVAVRALDGLVDPDPDPSQRAADALLRHHLRSLIGLLPQRERRILALRYGLSDQVPRTLEEVARRMDLSRERVRQLEHEGLEKLRAARPEHLRDYLE